MALGPIWCPPESNLTLLLNSIYPLWIVFVRNLNSFQVDLPLIKNPSKIDFILTIFEPLKVDFSNPMYLVCYEHYHPENTLQSHPFPCIGPHLVGSTWPTGDYRYVAQGKAIPLEEYWYFVLKVNLFIYFSYLDFFGRINIFFFERRTTNMYTIQKL